MKLLIGCSVMVVLYFGFAFLIAPDKYKTGWGQRAQGLEQCRI